MALLILPHKKRQVRLKKEEKEANEKEQQFQASVGKLRSLLNKISKDNFDKVQSQILNSFDFNPSLLKELMKIIFMKSTTETSYLDVYIQLCQNLFRKFNDPENEEMNFKRLLLSKCENQFNKMMLQE